LKKGSNIARAETYGQGLYLKSYNGSGLGMVGDGLYLKQGGQVISINGLTSWSRFSIEKYSSSLLAFVRCGFEFFIPLNKK